MGKILLLGGTGALGEYLVDELIRTNHSVYITSRNKHSNYGNIKFLHGNAKEDTFLNGILKDTYDCIVDFMIWPTSIFKEKIKKIITKTDHYIYLSSYRAYADADMKPLSEDSPLLIDVCTDNEYLKTDEYALAKGREEQILKDSSYNNYTILRPAITFSKSRFQIGTLEASSIIPRTIRKQPLLLPRDMIMKRAAVSWAGDVGRMMAFLLGKDRAKQEIFNVATAESHTWGEIATYYHNIIGTNIILCDLDSYIKVVRGPYQVRYDRMLNRLVDNSKILNFMGISNDTLIPIKDALKKELKNFPAISNRIKEDTALCKRMDEQINRLPKPLEYLFPQQNYIESNHQDNVKNTSIMLSTNNLQNNVALDTTKDKVGILNFHFANNYGAVLVPFAMKKVIEKMGYRTEIINYVAQKFSRQPAFIKFRGKYLSPISREFSTIEELKKHHDSWNRVVVGSDQVWRMFQTDIYMLGWAFGKCSLISYAASYGHDMYEGSIPKSDACTLLHRFDAISVREKSGVDICHNDFDIDAVQVLDPTLLLNSDDYTNIIEAEKINLPSAPYVCGVFLSAQSASYLSNPNVLLDIRSKYKLINPIKDEHNQFRPVGEWLALIKNAKYVITDSFHGAVFSIIFNKQFIAIMHDGFNGNARIPSLLNSLGIDQDRVYYSIKDVTVSSFLQKINYIDVNNKLHKLRARSILFLQESLAKPVTEKNPVTPIDSYEAIKALSTAVPFAPSQSRFYRKWVELKLAEMIASYETKNKSADHTYKIASNTKKKTPITTFCIYWIYRGLFRISFGNLKARFKEKRAYYRNIVKGK